MLATPTYPGLGLGLGYPGVGTGGGLTKVAAITIRNPDPNPNPNHMGMQALPALASIGHKILVPQAGPEYL